MEKRINELPGVAEATITYATKQLRITAENYDALLPQIQDICSSIESEVKVVPKETSNGLKTKVYIVENLDCANCAAKVEAALGADMVAEAESRELAEKGFLTSSCCPAFVTYIRQSFPQLLPMVSHNLSPMAALARFIKETTPDAKTIFIGPCTAKKAEAQLDTVKPYIDAVLTFEELQALFDSRDLDITTLPEDVLDNASYFGRIFARSGGLSDAVAEGLKEQNIDFDLKPCVCDGIEACRMALLKKSKNALDANFIEGMACLGGCIGGAGCLTHGEKNKAEVDKYGREAYEKTIADATSVLK